VLDMDATSHRHPAFEKRGCAMIGLNIAVDRRWLLRSVDGETGILQNLHVPSDGNVRHGAGRIPRYDDVAIDDAAQQAGAGGISGAGR
jgi:hypothetical protein